MGRLSYAVLWAVTTSLLLGALYFGLHASMSDRDVGGRKPRTYGLTISRPRPGTELPIFRVMQGDAVALILRSDTHGEAHLHGYEKKISLNPGDEVTLTFAARDAGLYPLHLHMRLDSLDPDSPIVHRHLAAIEVQAK